MDGETIRQRLALLRGRMRDAGIDYFLIPTADSHSSEYAADHFQVRRYFSGFTGSNGTLVVGLREAGLWTDGRYFIQAEKQLCGTGIDLYREGEEGVPAVRDWLKDHLPEQGTLAFDGRCISVRAAGELKRKLAQKKARFVTDLDPAEGIWTDRPALPSHPLIVLGEEYTGESTASRLTRLREKMRGAQADLYIENRLDILMWLFNIRGRDIECTPVALSYGVITMERQILFIQESEVTEEVREYAGSIGLELLPYEEVFDFLEEPSFYRDLSGSGRIPRVFFDPAGINIRLWEAVQRGRRAAYPEEASADPVHFDVRRPSPAEHFKAVKNRTELRNIRSCYREDSAAVCRFLYWLHQHVENGTVDSLTEVDAAEKMDALRAGISDYVELSFGTISAYGPNAAMMHYSAGPDTCARLRPEGMLLVDSGGQYMRGTTDVTRTMALGPVSDDMKKHYTLTAVGNLQLMDAVFLYGCTGRNVDILARQPLWDSFIDYKCGTGHGIGYLLSVHEGPHNIRWRFSAGSEEAVLEEGMIVSDEPGVYVEGKYGIRIETILEVVKAVKNGDGQFMRFAPLTFVPLDPALIDPAYLTPRTRNVLNRYHERVYEEVAPFLNDEERAWLRRQTEPL